MLTSRLLARDDQTLQRRNWLGRSFGIVVGMVDRGHRDNRNRIARHAIARVATIILQQDRATLTKR